MAAYGASAKPSVPDAVAMRREEPKACRRGSRRAGLGGRVVIASYLLAQGFFHDQLGKAGADLVTEPLLPSPVLAEIALERYDAAVAPGSNWRQPPAPETVGAANAQQPGFFKASRRFVTKCFPR